MKNLSAAILILVLSGLFLTSCEKEYLNTGIPGNSSQNVHKDGEGETDEDGPDDDDDDDDDTDGITDGGRDEDYDKSGKGKKPKQ